MCFRVKIDGLASSDFLEVSFPEATLAAGREQLTNLVLRRGVNANRELCDWWSASNAGEPARRNVSVALLDAQGGEQIRWKFTGARPVKYSLSRLNALEPAVLVETVEMEVDGFERG